MVRGDGDYLIYVYENRAEISTLLRELTTFRELLLSHPRLKRLEQGLTIGLMVGETLGITHVVGLAFTLYTFFPNTP